MVKIEADIHPTKKIYSISCSLGQRMNFNGSKAKLLYINHLSNPSLASIIMTYAGLQERQWLCLLGLTFSTNMKWKTMLNTLLHQLLRQLVHFTL